MGGTILVVDDDDDVRLFLRVFLKRHGYNVVSAIDRQEALGEIENAEVRFDAVLLDYMMPGPNVIRFLDLVSYAAPQTRVVLMTAAYRVEPLARMLGLATFVAKPFDERKLLQAIGATPEQQAAVAH
jgi:DNA-binding NtrC family response regulator